MSERNSGTKVREMQRPPAFIGIRNDANLSSSHIRILGLVALMLCANGCRSMNRTQEGGLVGTGIGAITGAMIGASSGNADSGALIGGAAGLLAGSMIGAEEDAIERDIAVQHAQYEQRLHAMSNVDLVEMTRAGVSDSVIIGAARDRGGNFDLSPAGIISLKNQGVSDGVILAAQNAPRREFPVVRHTTPTRSVSYSVGIGPPPVVVYPRPVHVHHSHYGHRYHGRGYYDHCDW